MKLRNFIFLIVTLISFNVNAQIPTKVFEITRILVDACDNIEGANEMFQFQIGPNPINISTLRVDGAGGTGGIQTGKWPNTANSWLGIASSPAKPIQVAQLNASIQNCGKLIEPVGGVLPAGKKVILVTSTNFNPTANSFANLTDTIYIIFQNSGNTNGHFANYSAGSSTRTLRLKHLPSGVYDEVEYDKSLLTDQNGQHIAQDGAGVTFTYNGFATYYNNGCMAPYEPLGANWICPTTICQSSAPLNLNSLINGTVGGNWGGVGVNGNMFNPNGLSGPINITYTVGGANCFISETHTINVLSQANASWNGPSSICQNANIINLSNYISGTPGGIFSGTGVNSNNFNPTGLLGNIVITYTVGSGICIDSLKDTINVMLKADANWTNPSKVCPSELPLILDSLILGTPGGTWSGIGVNGNKFDKSGNSLSYDITYHTGIGICLDSLKQTIDIDSISASFTANPTTGSTPLVVSVNNTSSGYNQWIWTSSQGDNSTNNPEQFNFNTPGNKSIQLWIKSANGCVDSISKTIIIEDKLEIEIPNVFTPNDDPYNNIFFSDISVAVDDYSLEIYNRWGDLVKKCDISGWNGTTKNGHKASDGVYFYVIRFNKFGKEYFYRGTVSLIRE